MSDFKIKWKLSEHFKIRTSIFVINSINSFIFISFPQKSSRNMAMIRYKIQVIIQVLTSAGKNPSEI